MTGAGDGVAGESSGRTVMVGMKMDSQSRELLTWALVKVAQTGDHVVALHVLNDNGELSIYGSALVVFFLLIVCDC